MTTTPRIVYPSNGGLMNRDFEYRTHADLKRDLYGKHERTARTLGGGSLPLKHTSVAVIVDRIVPVKRFGGA